MTVLVNFLKDLNIFVSPSFYTPKKIAESITFTTKYNKWNTISRPYPFSTIKYTEATTFITNSSIPKLSSGCEKKILKKVLEQDKTLASYIVKNGNHHIYYT